MSTALAQLKAFAQKSQGEDAVRRYASWSLTAAQLAGALGTAYPASGHLAYKAEQGGIVTAPWSDRSLDGG